MRGKNVSHQSDRSYLCLVAIYAIHAILLNVVFLQPNFDIVQSTLTLPSAYGTDTASPGFVINIKKNFSQTVIMKVDPNKFLQNHIIFTSPRPNTTVHGKRKKIIPPEQEDYQYTMKLPTRKMSQSKSGGSALHFGVTSKTSSILRLMNQVISDARSIIERLSPAALGIISGCLVFLLTFTENDYV